MKQSINSKRKGKRGELEAVKLLQDLGYAAERTVQYCGRGGVGDIRIIGHPELVIEVKCKKNLDMGTSEFLKILSKASKDSDGRPWLILWKPDHKKWRATTGYFTAVGDEGIRAVIDLALEQSI